MEFFRWILVITGIVLLGIAFMMGRSKRGDHAPRQARTHAYGRTLHKTPVKGRDTSVEDRLADSGATDNRQDWHSNSHVSEGAYQPASEPGADTARSYASDSDLNASYGTDEPGFGGGQSDEALDTRVSLVDDVNTGDRVTMVGPDQSDRLPVTSFASAVKAASAASAVNAASAASAASAQDSQDHSQVGYQADSQGESASADDYNQNFSEEFETYHEPVELDEFEEKLVSVHVVASTGRRFYGKDLKALFDQHGYTFGRMSLYHCALDGDKVFSVANMVKPGTFNEDQMASFETPGITLFMRLPIELDSDVAFDFLIREAKELAEELGGQLRDSSRNPLSEQTIQHMREDIQQYVFRSKQILQPVT